MGKKMSANLASSVFGPLRNFFVTLAFKKRCKMSCVFIANFFAIALLNQRGPVAQPVDTIIN